MRDDTSEFEAETMKDVRWGEVACLSWHRRARAQVSGPDVEAKSRRGSIWSLGGKGKQDGRWKEGGLESRGVGERRAR